MSDRTKKENEKLQLLVEELRRAVSALTFTVEAGAEYTEELTARHLHLLAEAQHATCPACQLPDVVGVLPTRTEKAWGDN